MTQETNRRSFLSWLIFGLGTIFSAVLGLPVLCYLIDPRHRAGKPSNFKQADGIRLDALVLNTPIQGVIRNTWRDGWTLYPNDVVGRIWVVMVNPRPANLNNNDAIKAFNANDDAKKNYLVVLTARCPHLGCSVNLNVAKNGFACPCHAAAFSLHGTREGEANPATRPMDTLDWKLDEQDPARLLVQYQKFVTSISEKKLA